MPPWFWVTLVALAVVPGVVMVLAGVVAMFVAPADYDRRRRRLAEGHCVHCGYDLRGGTDVDPVTALCPECGRPPFELPDPVRRGPDSSGST